MGSNERLVNVHVDDLGMCQATLPAFAGLWRRGAVTSVSLMVPCPWFSSAARLCHELPQVDAGVHLTLTSEWEGYRWGPLSTRDPSSGLVDGEGWAPATRRALHERAAPEAVEREIEAQIDRAVAAGLAPSHVDSHMYAVAHPELMPRYVELALARGLLPLTWRPGGGAFWSPEERARKLLGEWAERGVPVPERLAVLRLDGHQSRDERLAAVRRLIDSLPPGLTHLAVHPAVDTPELRAAAADWRSRVAEYETLADPAVAALWDAAGIRRVGWRDLRHARGAA